MRSEVCVSSGAQQTEASAGIEANYQELVSLSIGNSVLEANGINGRAVVTGNYISPMGNLPLPWPDGDWYLRQTLVPAIREGETVICNTLIPGLLDYYREVGLIPENTAFITSDPLVDGEVQYGFPFTDPLENLPGDYTFDDDSYLCSTFGGSEVSQQAARLGLRTLDRASSDFTNNKAFLRQMAAANNIDMLPGALLSSFDQIDAIVSADWNTDAGAWLKFPTGSGGDLVYKLNGPFDEESLLTGVNVLRDAVKKAFSLGRFAVQVGDYWLDEEIAPGEYPLVVEADAHIFGDVIANASTQFVARGVGEISLIGHYLQITTPEGEYLGNAPFEGMPQQLEGLARAQAQHVSDYNVRENGYRGIAAIDWFATRDNYGGNRLSVCELNSRPTANTPPVIIAAKLGAAHFLNTNVYTSTMIEGIHDFIDVVGKDLAFGDPRNEGMVVPQSFRTMVYGDTIVGSPNFKVAVLGRDEDHCQQVIEQLSDKGIRFTP